MKKSEFVTAVVCAIENLQLELLASCYDITSEARILVDTMTDCNDIEWDVEDEAD